MRNKMTQYLITEFGQSCLRLRTAADLYRKKNIQSVYKHLQPTIQGIRKIRHNFSHLDNLTIFLSFLQVLSSSLICSLIWCV
ncbi:hypothetical protein ACS0TY_013037 [Phlomoides rotata]